MRLKPGSVAASQSALIVLMVLAWLYITGRTYVADYLSLLKIGAAQLHVPAELYVTYGAYVARYERWRFVALTAAFMAQLYFMWRVDVSALRALALIAFALVMAFWSAHVLGRSTAAERFQFNVYSIHLGPDTGATGYIATREDGTPPYVKITLRGAAEANVSAAGTTSTRDILAGGCAIAVWRDLSAVYVVKPQQLLQWNEKDRRIVWQWRAQSIGPGTMVPFETIRVPHDAISTMQISDRKIPPCSPPSSSDQ